jgi:hypothetical protein
MVSKLRELLNFLNDFNTTSGRIVATIGLAYLTGMRVLILDKFLGPIPVEVLGAWCMFLGALGGMDVWQYKVKRNSYIPEGEGPAKSLSANISGGRAMGHEEGVEITP